jgi:F-type H+-transporting ATPase subunit a
MFGREVWVTDTVISMWIICAVMIAFAIVVRTKLNKFKDAPRGFQNAVELMVETMDGFVSESISPRHAYFGKWFFGVFAFLILSNMSALVKLRPPTADLAMTAALAVTSFFLIHFVGIITAKKRYFKEYIEPIPLFLPVHLISELAVPVSLSFRLFGNILGGFIIMELIYALLPVFFRVALPAPLHIYFEIFAAALQSYIFCVLSMTFMKNKMHLDAE